MSDLISRLSEIRSNYNCFDENEEPYYRALSEAIRLVKELSSTHKALDTISRAAAIEIVDRYNKSHMILKGKPMLGAASIVIELEELPSAQPEIEERNGKSAQNVPKEDLISRKAAIEAILSRTNCKSVRDLYEYNAEHDLHMMWTGGIVDAIDMVIGVPSAEPERKTGRWIERDSNGVWQCDQCRKYCLIYKAHYCPNCGAYMGGEQDETQP